MITVEVGEKNTGELGEADVRRSEHLVLCPLTTVEEPPLATLGQVERGRRDIACPRRCA